MRAQGGWHRQPLRGTVRTRLRQGGGQSSIASTCQNTVGPVSGSQAGWAQKPVRRSRLPVPGNKFGEAHGTGQEETGPGRRQQFVAAGTTVQVHMLHRCLIRIQMRDQIHRMARVAQQDVYMQGLVDTHSNASRSHCRPRLPQQDGQENECVKTSGHVCHSRQNQTPVFTNTPPRVPSRNAHMEIPISPRAPHEWNGPFYGPFPGEELGILTSCGTQRPPHRRQ
mgnify:CR=1 FL=1